MKWKIDWKSRFRNRVWLMSLVSTTAAFVFTLLSLLGITPGWSEEQVMKAAEAALLLLSMVGVVMDPTTEGVGDGEKMDKESEKMRSSILSQK